MVVSRRSFLKGGFASLAAIGSYPSYVVGDHLVNNEPQGNFNYVEYSGPKCIPLENPVELSIGTWNLANIPIKQDFKFNMSTEDRLKAASEYLCESEVDIIGLQEMFSPYAREDILWNLEGLGSKLRYHTYFPSNLGSGLFTLSSYPLENAYFQQFNDLGDILEVWEAEWFAGKGVSHNNVLVNDSLCLDFCNSHVHARYRKGDGKDELRRRNQRREILEYANDNLLGSGLFFLVGDLNCKRNTFELEEFEDLSGYESMLDESIGFSESKDYIFAKSDLYNVEILNTSILPETINKGNKAFDLSDHFGYVSKIRIS